MLLVCWLLCSEAARPALIGAWRGQRLRAATNAVVSAGWAKTNWSVCQGLRGTTKKWHASRGHLLHPDSLWVGGFNSITITTTNQNKPCYLLLEIYLDKTNTKGDSLFSTLIGQYHAWITAFILHGMSNSKHNAIGWQNWPAHNFRISVPRSVCTRVFNARKPNTHNNRCEWGGLGEFCSSTYSFVTSRKRSKQDYPGHEFHGVLQNCFKNRVAVNKFF